MGNVNGIINGNMAETLAELARNRKVKYDTLYRKARRKFPAEIWDAESVVRPEHVAVLFPEKRELIRRKRKAIFTTEQQPDYIQPAPAEPGAPDTPPARQGWRWPMWAMVRRVLFEVLAITIVCGHGFLLWQEAAELFGYIGNIGGAVIFAVVCLAVLIASDSSRNRTSLFALWFMVFVDAAAGFVHYEALRTPVVPDAMTVGFCIFICASSFVALLLFRDSKLD